MHLCTCKTDMQTSFNLNYYAAAHGTNLRVLLQSKSGIESSSYTPLNVSASAVTTQLTQ